MLNIESIQSIYHEILTLVLDKNDGKNAKGVSCQHLRVLFFEEKGRKYFVEVDDDVLEEEDEP